MSNVFISGLFCWGSIPPPPLPPPSMYIMLKFFTWDCSGLGLVWWLFSFLLCLSLLSCGTVGVNFFLIKAGCGLFCGSDLHMVWFGLVLHKQKKSPCKESEENLSAKGGSRRGVPGGLQVESNVAIPRGGHT